MATVSVIIPVYNTEKFLGRCLDSLRAQSFGDWEAVCVDDGSTDGSGPLLDSFAAADPRIRVVHKANGGVSEARNLALGLIGGEYLTFVDSDDFLHPRALEITTAAARRDGSDLVAYTYDRKYRTRLIIRHALGLGDPAKVRFSEFDPSATEGLLTDDIFSWVTEMSDGKVPGGDSRWAVKHCQPWRCLYRSEAVKGIRFIPGIIYEDFPWWGEVLSQRALRHHTQPAALLLLSKQDELHLVLLPAVQDTQPQDCDRGSRAAVREKSGRPPGGGLG